MLYRKLSVAAVLSLVASPAFAQDGTFTPSPSVGSEAADRIFFDFKNKSILVYGLYSEKDQGKRNGVDAEISARREGKQILANQTENLCKNSSFSDDWNERLKPRKDWNPNLLTSQGSEIFPGANLLIRLTASLEKIFPKYPPNRVNAIQGADKETFVFKIPPLPLSILKCGAIPLYTNRSSHILVLPGYASSVPQGTTLVQLSIHKDGLMPTTPPDAAALKRSGFMGLQSDKQPTLLPVETAE
jgi:hypothetical protein